MIHDFFFRQIKYYLEMQNRQFFISNTILILLQKLCTIFREATMSRPHKKKSNFINDPLKFIPHEKLKSLSMN